MTQNKPGLIVTVLLFCLVLSLGNAADDGNKNIHNEILDEISTLNYYESGVKKEEIQISSQKNMNGDTTTEIYKSSYYKSGAPLHEMNCSIEINADTSMKIEITETSNYESGCTQREISFSLDQNQGEPMTAEMQDISYFEHGNGIQRNVSRSAQGHSLFIEKYLRGLEDRNKYLKELQIFPIER